MTPDRPFLTVLRRVIAAAADPTRHASLEDLTTVQLAADDIEASLDAYEQWLGRQAEPTELEVVIAAQCADVFVGY